MQSVDKIKTHVRRAYKILRPGGREYGIVFVSFNAHSKVTALRGWCIPAQGKDYEVKDKEAVEISLPQGRGQRTDLRRERQAAADSRGGSRQHCRLRIRRRRAAHGVAEHVGLPARDSRPRDSLLAATSSRMGIQSLMDQLFRESSLRRTAATSGNGSSAMCQAMREEAEMPPISGRRGTNGRLVLPSGRRFAQRIQQLAARWVRGIST